MQTFSKCKRALLVVFAFICVLYRQAASAQNDVQFTGIANVPTVVNPASAGHSGAVRAVCGYKKQWVGISGSPSTTALGIDAEVKFLKNFHGIGAMAFYDVIGPLSTINLHVNYSFHVELDKGLLGIGARIGAQNISYSTSDLSPSVDGYETDYHQSSDPLLDGGDDGGTALDLGIGAFFQSKKSYLSFSVLHINSPTITTKEEVKVHLKPLMTLGAGRIIGKDINLEPRMSLKTDFASWQMELSGLVNIRQKVNFGMGYRVQESLFFLFGLNLENGLQIGYAYDLTVSKLIRYSSGSHEVTLGYTFNIDIERRTKRYKSVRIL